MTTAKPDRTKIQPEQTPGRKALKVPAAGLGRRLAGIGVLFACALIVDPARIVPEASSFAQIDLAIALQALAIPGLAALGLWLVLPSRRVLAICVLTLAGAHSELGSEDLFAGYLYPALAALAAAFLTSALWFKSAARSGKPL